METTLDNWNILLFVVELLKSPAISYEIRKVNLTRKSDCVPNKLLLRESNNSYWDVIIIMS